MGGICCRSKKYKPKKPKPPRLHNVRFTKRDIKKFFSCEAWRKCRCCPYCYNQARNVPCIFYCYVGFLSCESFWFHLLSLILIFDRYFLLLDIPYDWIKDDEFTLYVIVLMIIQAFVFLYSFLSLCYENETLFFYAMIAQLVLIARGFFLYGNYMESVYFLPVLYTILFILPHCLCGWCSRRKYGFKKFDKVSTPQDQKLYSSWKRVESLLYFDMLSMVVVVIIGLTLLDFSIIFYLASAFYFIFSLVFNVCLTQICYHEQWKCVTIFYILIQTYPVLYLIYKTLSVLSGNQIDELSPVWDDNEYWELIWVLLNLGSSSIVAIFVRLFSFFLLLSAIVTWFSRKSKGRLTMSLYNRKPYPAPHWCCVKYFLLFGHYFGMCCECECCEKVAQKREIGTINVSSLVNVFGMIHRGWDRLLRVCGCCRGCFGLKKYDKIVIERFILDLREEKTLEEELELLEVCEEEREKKEKRGWWGRRCRFCISVVNKLDRRTKEEEEEEEEDEKIEFELLDKMFEDDDELLTTNEDCSSGVYSDSDSEDVAMMNNGNTGRSQRNREDQEGGTGEGRGNALGLIGEVLKEGFQSVFTSVVKKFRKQQIKQEKKARKSIDGSEESDFIDDNSESGNDDDDDDDDPYLETEFDDAIERIKKSSRKREKYDSATQELIDIIRTKISRIPILGRLFLTRKKEEEKESKKGFSTIFRSSVKTVAKKICVKRISIRIPKKFKKKSEDEDELETNENEEIKKDQENDEIEIPEEEEEEEVVSEQPIDTPSQTKI